MLRTLSLRLLLLCTVTAVIAAGCGGGGNHSSSHPATVSINAGNAQTGVVNAELPEALVITARDSSGRAAAGRAVSWSVAAGGGSILPATQVTDSAGTASARWTLGTVAGAQGVTARVTNIGAVTFNATAQPGSLSTVVLTSPSLQPYEGDSVQLVANAKDEFGNTIPGQPMTWSSDDEERFPVSSTGLLRTWGYGPVTVTAQSQERQGQVVLQVLQMNLQVTLGTKEVAFDWTTDRCEDYDVPDGPARFVRAQDGTLVMFDSNAPRYYVSRGATFAKLSRDCAQPALLSELRTTPESYENNEWLWAVYREGSTWHALIHNEFHDAVALTCQPGNPYAGNPCWYNSLTYAVSTDEAGTFTKPAPPGHVVAPAPNAWISPPPGIPVGNGYVEGYFNGTNIVRGPDDYYYAFLMAIPTQNWYTRQGTCAFRTKTLGDPTSWRAWDGSGFNLRMTSPYVTGAPATVCTFLDTLLTHSHVVYSTYLKRYVAVASGQGALDVDGRPTCGFFYGLSPDLVHWTTHRLLAEASLPWCAAEPSQPGVLEPLTVLYPSLVDHADTTVNFERAGQTQHLYYTRFNDGGLDRDLVRVPVTFTKTN